MSDTLSHRLYPRLPLSKARTRIASRKGLSLVDLMELSELRSHDAAPNPVGGSVVETERLERIRDGVRALASDFGFPERASQSAQAQFDRMCGTFLFAEMGIVPADAGSRDVWANVTLVLLPEITPWRFPSDSDERLLGGVRNTLQRLWWRAWSLGPDLTFIPDGCTPFGEDDYVQVMERPAIGGNVQIARAFQDVVWKTDLSESNLSRSNLVRSLSMRVLARKSHIAFDALTHEQLQELMCVLRDESLAQWLPKTGRRSAIS